MWLVRLNQMCLLSPFALHGRKCQGQAAKIPAHCQPAATYLGREIPSLLIRNCNVERFIPSRAAAPLRPAITQLHS